MVLAGCLWWWEATSFAPRPAPIQHVTDDEQAAIETLRIEQMVERHAALFPDAPPEVLAIARVIDEGGAPTGHQIAALPPGALNTAWSEVTKPKVKFKRVHTLLRHAVEALNVEAARALIAAGADPFYNFNEMPYAALQKEDRPDQYPYWFPDYRRGNALLRLWLESGGSVEARYPGDSFGYMLIAAPANNLEAVFILLEAGADPWFQPVGGYFDDGSAILGDSFHLANANASIRSSEVAFRLALEGHYRGGRPEQIDELLQYYDRTAAQYVGSTGPDNLHSVWGMQKLLPLVLEQTGRPPEGSIAALLAMRVPEDIGGFWLGPGEIRSPMVPEQRLRDDNQYGRQMWVNY